MIRQQAVPAYAMPPGGGFGTTPFVTGTEPITYQWAKDGVPADEPLQEMPDEHSQTFMPRAIQSVLTHNFCQCREFARR